MKRLVYIKSRTATIIGIILLPIRIVLLPFRLLRRAVFFRRPKHNKFKRPNDTMITVIFNKLRSSVSRLNHTNERITSLNDIHSHRIDSINVDIKALEDRNEVLSTRINNQLGLINDNNSDINDHANVLNKKIKTIEDKVERYNNQHHSTNNLIGDLLTKRIKTLEDKLKAKDSGIVKDLTFHMVSEPTDEELHAIELEAMQDDMTNNWQPSHRPEPDFKAEQKALAKQIAEQAEEDRDWVEYQKDAIENPEPTSV